MSVTARINNLLALAGVRLSRVKTLTAEEELPWNVVSSALQECDVKNIFDVGAFQGDTVSIERNLFPSAKIYAFEPLDSSCRVLRERYSNDSKVVVEKIALSDRKGNAKLNITASVQSNSILTPAQTGLGVDEHHQLKRVVDIKTTTIDIYCDENGIDSIDFLKMDVQGAELSVLRGGRRMLERGVKVILAEVEFVKLYQGQPLYHDIALHLEEFGYGLYDICKPRNDKCGQLAWADAVFCHNSLLDRIRKRNVPDVKAARETA